MPRVLYGVDGMLALHANQPADASATRDALVICIGNYTTVVTAMVGGSVRPDAVRRINFGASVAADYLLRLMQCKYPSFPVKMTLWQARVRQWAGRGSRAGGDPPGVSRRRRLCAPARPP